MYAHYMLTYMHWSINAGWYSQQYCARTTAYVLPFCTYTELIAQMTAHVANVCVLYALWTHLPPHTFHECTTFIPAVLLCTRPQSSAEGMQAQSVAS